MKLSTRINFIILPVISVIFTIAGSFAFFSQKDSVFNALNSKLEYQSTYVVNYYHERLLELDSLLKQLLNSLQVTEYLSNHKGDYAKYSSENQLIRFISNIATNSEKALAIQLYDMDGKTIFSYDSDDPFATQPATPGLINYINEIKSSLSPDRAVNLMTTRYSVTKMSENEYQLSVYRTFSPEQSIYDDMFSLHSTLYTAKISTRININDELLPYIHNAFSAQTQLDIAVNHAFFAPGKELSVNYSYDKASHNIQAHSPVLNTNIQPDQKYINSLLFPYLISIISLVFNITIISFVLLKKLINRQIIKPIENLNSKVEKAIQGDMKALKLIDKKDEVSSLNNSYIKLLDDLNTLARRDSLTGLANRSVFSSALLRCVEDAIKHSTTCALFYIDLDNFKSVNDQYGHDTGDRVLVEFSTRLTDTLRKEDIIVKPSLYSDIARLAGDEFAVILPYAPGTEIIADIAKRIVSICKNGIEVDGIRYDIHASVGIAVSPFDATDADTLMKRADTAMYQIKNTVKNGYHFYSEELEKEQKRNSEIEQAIKAALKNNNFLLHFMPMYHCGSGEIENIECLIRTSDEYLKQYGPDVYIPIAEHTGLIKELDLWVFETAIQHFRQLIDEENYHGHISINFSSYQLKNDDFAPMISQLISQYQVPAAKIDMEITETCLINNDQKVIDRLEQLKEAGVNLSLDDFGTGFTAFSQLHLYPVDSLKIDRSFVNLISELPLKEKEHRPLVDIIIELASLYNLSTIAEGIETSEQLNYVSKLGCTLAQGFYLQKPVPYQELVTILGQHKASDFYKKY